MMLVDIEEADVPQNNDAEIESGIVSCLNKCLSGEAKKLCIFDVSHKLKTGGEYDIGGTYTESGSDLWFYCTTSVCPGNNYLLNLFICHRKTGNFSVGVSDSNELKHTARSNEISGSSELSHTLIWHTFTTAHPNEVYYIKTFCFTDKSLKSFEPNTLFIPVTIVMNSTHTINHDYMKYIKYQHDLSGLLSKKEKTDFTLLSMTGKIFPVHKIILVAHSPILRNIIKDTDRDAFIDIEDSDMELLLQFLYTGTIKDIPDQDCVNLLRIAEKFQLQNLFLLTQYALGEQINIENAVEIALISQKYKLEQLRQNVFGFISNNKKVMQTKSWKELNDVELTKQLIEHIYGGEQ